MYAESGRSLINIADICETATNMSNTTSSCLFEPAALVFGSDDFCASIGASRTEDSNEIMYARQHVVLVAKAYHLQAIDMVFIDYNSNEFIAFECYQ